jgi:hypothetical protein
VTAQRRGRPRTWNCTPQTALDRLGNERNLVLVTLPRLTALDVTHEYDAQEAADAAARVAERRVIRNGVEAWQAINKAESFEGWATIGKALAVGRDYALRATGANDCQPMKLRRCGKPL